MLQGLTDYEGLDYSELGGLAAVCALPWIADGISAREQDAARDVALLAVHHGYVFRALAPQDWLDDGLTQAESEVLFALREVAERDDGVAQRIAAMPFWATLEPWRSESTLEALAEFGREMPGLFNRSLSVTWIADGLIPPELDLIKLLGQFSSDESKELARIRNTAMSSLDNVTPRVQIQDGLNPVEAELYEQRCSFQEQRGGVCRVRPHLRYIGRCVGYSVPMISVAFPTLTSIPSYRQADVGR